MTICEECEAACVWDDEVCSNICTQCGTLSDPSQSLLSTHIDNYDTSAAQYPTASSSTRKSIRNKCGWTLPGQGKESRDRKNEFAMHNFISSLLGRLSYPSISTRAITIFTQAMSRGNYKWGRKAKLTAGASIAVALREAQKSDLLRDIAFLLNESTVSLSRAFTAVVSLLQFKLDSTCPSVHFPIIQAHLQSFLRSQSSQLVPPLLRQDHLSSLKSVSFPSVTNTATSLSGILVGHEPPLPITQLPTPPTACAIFILAVEAELRSSLPHHGEFSEVLATRFGFARGVVMSRYKTIYDLVEGWIREVPWLEQFESKNNNRRGKQARSKVPKRCVVAKGLKDVIQFQEEIWKKKHESQDKLDVVLEIDSEGENKDDESEHSLDSDKSPTMTVENRVADTSIEPPRKKRKTMHKNLDDAYQFLLDPLSTSIPSDPAPSSIISYMLAYPFDAFSFHPKPTRLQELVAARGGSEVDHIDDDELFEEDEWEGTFRSEEEREQLEPLFMLEWGEDESSLKPNRFMKENANTTGQDVACGANRIDMAALARILDGKADVDEEVPHEKNTGYAGREESPGGNGGVDMYDQEYY